MPVDLIARLMDGYLSTQLLYVAAQLGIADLLRDGSRSSDELATLTATQPAVLHRVLRGLAVDGVLDEDANGRFVLTDVGRSLDSSRADSARGAVIARGELYYQAAGSLLESVRQGGTPFRHANGLDFFDAIAANPEHTAAFHASMTARSKREAEEVLRTYDFGRFSHIVDVGGGHGVLLTAILKAGPHLHATLFDRPEVVAGARPWLDAAGMASRCRIMGGDFFAGVPTGGDLYVLSRVVHDWDDDAAMRVLTSCREAIADGGLLLIVEAVMPERARDRPAAIRIDLPC